MCAFYFVGAVSHIEHTVSRGKQCLPFLLTLPGAGRACWRMKAPCAAACTSEPERLPPLLEAVLVEHLVRIGFCYSVASAALLI